MSWSNWRRWVKQHEAIDHDSPACAAAAIAQHLLDTPHGGVAAWADITGKPATFPPEAHGDHLTAQQAADAAPVQSVAGKAGAVTLAKADVGLGNVDNTSDAAKPVSTATQTALDAKAASGHNHDGTYAAAGHNHDASYAALSHDHDADYEAVGAVAAHAGAADPHTGYQKESEKGQANGYASLDGDGKVPAAQLPAGQGAPAWGDVTGTLADQTDLQAALDAKAASGHDHDSDYAAIGHDHAGTYEPANANIQAHVAAAHAPSNAQKNSDITKAEIEAKLTGEISSHTHAGGGDPSAAWPVGSVFLSVLATNPATLLGFGTWVAIAAGRVLVGQDSGDADFLTAGLTGGAKTHTLTTAEIPSHTHTQRVMSSASGGASGAVRDTSSNSVVDDAQQTGATGGGGAHNNLQPYFVVHIWQRTL